MRQIDRDNFLRLLRAEMDDTYTSPSDVLNLPGVLEIAEEHFHNAVLDRWRDGEGERLEDEANMRLDK